MRNYKFIGFFFEGYLKGLFINHRTLLILNKFHQYEQSPLRRKENLIQLKLKQIQKKSQDPPLVN